MPQLLLLVARYVAIFGLVVALLLIFVRWRFPQKQVKEGGTGSASEPSPSYWRALWKLYLRARRQDKERDANLRAIRAKSVLVVDSDEKSCKVLIWKLQQLGCSILRARSGGQAIKLVREFLEPVSGSARSVDVVVSDALLPDISALDFCDILADYDIPIVLVGVLKAQRDELTRVGDRVACLGKPYDPDDAAALAGKMLARRLKVGTPQY